MAQVTIGLRNGTSLADKLIALAAVLALAAPASAGLIQGGGDKRTDCYAELDVAGASGSNKVTCTDGDPLCDTDGKCDDTCSFQVSVCVNQTNVPGCTPKALKKVRTAPRLDVPAISGSPECGNPTTVTVRVKTRARHKKIAGRKKVTVTATATTKPRLDRDVIVLTCQPHTGPCVPATSTTTLPRIGTLGFTTVPGTAACGGPSPTGFTEPNPPFGGEVDDGTGAKLNDLGIGCLYMGGGGAAVAADLIPDGATNFLDVFGVLPAVTLGASAGTNPADCTKGPGPGQHCINKASATECTGDAGCGATPGSCALDANCFFGPPLPITGSIPALSTCVINVIAADGSGTADSSTGNSSISFNLASRVYLTGNSVSPCPKCVSGTCAGGQDNGAPCTPVGSIGTSVSCRPAVAMFQASLPVNIAPITTGVASSTAADGMFCSGQPHAGAFHLPGARTIKETGAPAGDVSDGQPHHSQLAATFCVQATGNAGVDGLADLPGPAAINLTGNAKLTQ